MTKIDKTGEKLVAVIAEGMKEKKAKRITVLDLRSLEQAVCDYFVICNAESTTQVNSIADSVEHFSKKELNEKPLHIEGVENAIWVLLDYGDVVVHVFQDESRAFYDIEEFWADAVRIEHAEDETSMMK
ncbi:MAG: ribosome silencing factor [Bacteroidota bacterium]